MPGAFLLCYNELDKTPQAYACMLKRGGSFLKSQQLSAICPAATLADPTTGDTQADNDLSAVEASSLWKTGGFLLFSAILAK